MAGWLIPLLRVGGTPVAAVIAVILMGRWLWAKIDKGLDSYTTAYLQQKAAIDARIERLEQLAEEQARLTRTVESIKDEIAAQRRSYDNRWAFRKDIYVNLIKLVSDLVHLRLGFLQLANLQRALAPTDGVELQAVHEQKAANLRRYRAVLKEYINQVAIARLAMADNVIVALKLPQPTPIGSTQPDPVEEQQIRQEVSALNDILRTLAEGGRKDLWGAPEPQAKA